MKFSEQDCLKAIVESVPQWYMVDRAPYQHSIKLNDSEIEFCSQTNLTERLIQFKNEVQYHIAGWYDSVSALSHKIASDAIKEKLALTWLKLHSKTVNWEKLFNYLKDAQSRSYENKPVLKNLIISSGTGTHDITDTKLSKILDPLTCSLFTYIQVGEDIKVTDYNQVYWSQVASHDKYKLYPEFLHAFYCAIPNDGFSAHLTTKGDWVILHNKRYRSIVDGSVIEYEPGMLLTFRNGNIQIYDSPNIKNMIFKIINTKPSLSKNRAYYVAANIFEILCDLSFMRKGSLLVYDPEDRLLDKIQNPNAVIDSSSQNEVLCAQNVLGPYIKNIAFGEKNRNTDKKRILLEIANVDGAVIFNDHSITAFGAMIKPHPGANDQVGARSTAALSAALHGAYPFKVSSDGQISIYSCNDGNSHPAVITFT